MAIALASMNGSHSWITVLQELSVTAFPLFSEPARGVAGIPIGFAFGSGLLAAADEPKQRYQFVSEPQKLARLAIQDHPRAVFRPQADLRYW